MYSLKYDILYRKPYLPQRNRRGREGVDSRQCRNAAAHPPSRQYLPYQPRPVSDWRTTLDIYDACQPPTESSPSSGCCVVFDIVMVVVVAVIN